MYRLWRKAMFCLDLLRQAWKTPQKMSRVQSQKALAPREGGPVLRVRSVDAGWTTHGEASAYVWVTVRREAPCEDETAIGIDEGVAVACYPAGMDDIPDNVIELHPSPGMKFLKAMSGKRIVLCSVCLWNAEFPESTSIQTLRLAAWKHSRGCKARAVR